MNFDHQNIPPGIRLPNGAIVISSKLADDCVVYLGLLADDKVTPFATWIARDGDPESTTHGHYHRTLDEALTDYNNREQGRCNMDYHEAIETVEAIIVRHCEKLRSEAEFLESFSIVWLARLRGSSDPQVRMQATAELQRIIVEGVPVLPMAETGSND
ncbi:MAG: hypothetical protein QGI31_09920 [Dehalococcoidia bacterium]|jgi:hypothetical protein|nr:hypothetical protein [Dehalococcoidia bacterium]